MADEEDCGSDSSDDNYVPSGEEAVSEDDQSGEDEDLHEAGEDVGAKKRTKRKRGSEKGFASRKRTGGIRLDGEDGTTPRATGGSGEEGGGDDYNAALSKDAKAERVMKREDEEKKRADSLWADFMKDTTPATKRSTTTAATTTASKAAVTPTGGVTTPSPAVAPQKRKVTLTKEFDFAGETIRVSKEVSADSQEAKAQAAKEKGALEGTLSSPGGATGGAIATSSLSSRLAGIKRTSGGLGSVLGKMGQKPKISTLEKSKLDWNAFKQEQGINEELQIHNRGKDGYMERQAFLLRADQRQFEVEKNLRLGTSKR